jgi:hexosaminidase
LGPPSTARIRRAALRPVAAVDAARLAPGLAYAYYERRVARAAVLPDWVPSARDSVGGVALKGTERAQDFGVRLQGFLRVPADAVYEFALESDDGSVLRIGGEDVIDLDGPHAARTATGAVALGAGYHALEVLFFQAEGDRSLELLVRTGNADAWRPIPPDWLYRGR